MKASSFPNYLTRPLVGLVVVSLTATALPAPIVAQQPPQIIAQAGESAYTLGPGDRIRIDVFNVPEYSGEYQVLVDGSINLPIVGSVNVQGLTLQGGANAISSRYARYLRRPIVTMSLIAPRPLKIGVTGEVNRPGVYNLALNGGTQFPTVSQALQLAGGVTQSGNISRIVVRRAGGRNVTVNLAQVVQGGNIFRDIGLRDGDTIFVPTAAYNTNTVRQTAASSVGTQANSAQIAVIGEVSRPGTYTVRGDAIGAFTPYSPPKLTRAIQTAGGLTPSAGISQIQIRRPTKNGRIQSIRVNLLPLLQRGDYSQDIFIEDGDTIFIPVQKPLSVSQSNLIAASSLATQTTGPINIVFVGEVSRPGTYPVRGETAGPNGTIAPPTLTQAIKVAGGLTPSASISGIRIQRTNKNGSTQAIAVNLNRLLRNADFSQDLLLQEGDKVFIPTRGSLNSEETNLIASSTLAPQTTGPINIALVGEVSRPGTYPVRGETAGPNGTIAPPTISQAIKIAGGLTPSANIREISIQRNTRSGKQTFNANLLQLLQNGDFNQDLILQEGDRVFIPTRPVLNAEDANLIAVSTLATQTTGPINVVVVGEVSRPGTYPVKGETAGPNGTIAPPTLTQAIKASGGFTPSANIRQVQVERNTRSGKQLLAVNLQQLLQSGDFTQDLVLQEGDKVLIPTRTVVDVADSNLISASTLATQSTGPINVVIVGEVNRPGTFPVKGEAAGPNGTLTPPTVTQAIQVAGGIKPTADIRQVQVKRSTRDGSTQVLDVNLWQLLQAGDSTQDILLQDGDTISIPTAPNLDPTEVAILSNASFSPTSIRVNVVGEVERAGTVEVPPNTTLNQAILTAGGFNRRARKRTVELVRLNPNGTVTKRNVEVDFAKGISEENNPTLRNNDVIVVGRSSIAQIGDAVGTVLQPIGSFFSLFNFFRIFN
ncbi:SLBB domain-containing protein [Merismopedia glauca]|nr:SLBB domain-containing protein [Merismopedia glauca]